MRELVAAGVEVFARPVIDFDASEYEVRDNVAVVTVAGFSYILTKPTDRTRGLDPLVPKSKESRSGLVRVEPSLPRRTLSAKRSRLWL